MSRKRKSRFIALQICATFIALGLTACDESEGDPLPLSMRPRIFPVPADLSKIPQVITIVPSAGVSRARLSTFSARADPWGGKIVNAPELPVYDVKSHRIRLTGDFYDLTAACAGRKSARLKFLFDDNGRQIYNHIGQPFHFEFDVPCGTEVDVTFTADQKDLVDAWAAMAEVTNRITPLFPAGVDFRPFRIVYPRWPGETSDSAEDVELQRSYAPERGLEFYYQFTLRHELGHQVAQRLSLFQGGGPQHYLDQCYSPDLALVEGWADFFAAWMVGDFVEDQPGFPGMFILNPVGDFYCHGYTNETRTAAFLWGLFDRSTAHGTIRLDPALFFQAFQNRSFSSPEELRDALPELGVTKEQSDALWAQFL